MPWGGPLHVQQWLALLQKCTDGGLVRLRWTFSSTEEEQESLGLADALREQGMPAVLSG